MFARSILLAGFLSSDHFNLAMITSVLTVYKDQQRKELENVLQPLNLYKISFWLLRMQGQT